MRTLWSKLHHALRALRDGRPRPDEPERGAAPEHSEELHLMRYGFWTSG